MTGASHPVSTMVFGSAGPLLLPRVWAVMERQYRGSNTQVLCTLSGHTRETRDASEQSGTW